uniref:ATP synthase subunit a n=1 Tax=Megaris sp. TaxID=2931300 RepID=A0A8T9ZX44_9HEMI|nr:ATPase subunit 6 [Megaris sp.]
MMTNLFSSFDPSQNNMMSMNWISSMIYLMILCPSLWMLPSRLNTLYNKTIIYMLMELKAILPMNYYKSIIMTLTLFMFIMLNNISGLLPYIFTSSSHMTLNLSLALPLWMMLMLFGWINKINHMFTHLVPNSTPYILMPFMVIIETISNLIRPSSLAIRLTANMIAGHLLITLLGNNMINSNIFMKITIMMIQTMLMMFETGVALIQAYVFSMLSTLYISEI